MQTAMNKVNSLIASSTSSTGYYADYANYTDASSTSIIHKGFISQNYYTSKATLKPTYVTTMKNTDFKWFNLTMGTNGERYLDSRNVCVKTSYNPANGVSYY
jgi:hypothetical protein